MLVAITDRKKSKEAFDLLCSTLANGRGVERFTRKVATPGYGQDQDVTWHSDEEIWTLLLPDPRYRGREGYFQCCYGLQNPHNNKNLRIDLQINLPHEGRNSRLRGMFARDINDNIYLCRTGKINGVTTECFWEHYRGDSLEVDDGSGTSTRVVCLGQIDSAKLPSRIKHLISEVKRIKSEAKHIKNSSAAISSATDKFTPEFSGLRSSYSIPETIEATVDHGPVVFELSRAIRAAGHEPFSDQQRDLFVTDGKDQMATLFEVKTDVSTTSIYQAVGQLMLNGYGQQPKVEKILVVPKKPTKETEQALKKLCIKVLTYDWKENKPIIPSLDGLLP